MDNKYWKAVTVTNNFVVWPNGEKQRIYESLTAEALPMDWVCRYTEGSWTYAKPKSGIFVYPSLEMVRVVFGVYWSVSLENNAIMEVEVKNPRQIEYRLDPYTLDIEAKYPDEWRTGPVPESASQVYEWFWNNETEAKDYKFKDPPLWVADAVYPFRVLTYEEVVELVEGARKLV